MGRLFPDGVPVLGDSAVTLRAHRASDTEAVVQQCTDPVTLRYTTVPRPYGRADAAEFLQRIRRAWELSEPTSVRYWAIDVDGFAGSIDYRPTGCGTAEIGFGLHPRARGRGLMRRAVALVLDYAFAADDVEVMHWRAVVGNWASRRIVWHEGFRLEGTVRGLCPVPRGGPRDGWIASLHRDDPRSPSQPWPHRSVSALPDT